MRHLTVKEAPPKQKIHRLQSQLQTLRAKLTPISKTGLENGTNLMEIMKNMGMKAKTKKKMEKEDSGVFKTYLREGLMSTIS